MDALEHPRFQQARDESRNPKLVAVGLVGIVVFTAGTLWAWSILRASGHGSVPQIAEQPAPRPPGPQAGMVFQFPFDPKVSAPALDGKVRERLRTYGWVDRGRGRIHIPIERAIEVYAKEHAR